MNMIHCAGELAKLTRFPTTTGLLKAMLIAERLENERLRRIIVVPAPSLRTVDRRALPEDQPSSRWKTPAAGLRRRARLRQQNNQRSARCAPRAETNRNKPGAPALRRTMVRVVHDLPYCAGILHRIGEDVSGAWTSSTDSRCWWCGGRNTPATLICGGAGTEAQLIENGRLPANVAVLSVGSLIILPVSGSDLYSPGRQPGIAFDPGRLGRTAPGSCCDLCTNGCSTS